MNERILWIILGKRLQGSENLATFTVEAFKSGYLDSNLELTEKAIQYLNSLFSEEVDEPRIVQRFP